MDDFSYHLVQIIYFIEAQHALSPKSGLTIFSKDDLKPPYFLVENVIVCGDNILNTFSINNIHKSYLSSQ